MRSFNQYFLNEAQDVHSVSDSIFTSGDRVPVFFTPTVMKRLEYAIENVTAFHVTDAKGLVAIFGKQGSKSTQVSAFTYPGTELKDFLNLAGGVETSGGYILELEGDISAYFSGDAFTARLEGGRRSVLLSGDIGDFESTVFNSYKNAFGEKMAKTVKALMSKLNRELLKLRNQLIDKHLKPLLPHLASGEYLDTFDMKRLRDTSGGRKALGRAVREYMDGMEKILKNEDRYKMLFLMPPRSEKNRAVMDYDEIIMNNFKVNRVHVFIRPGELWLLQGPHHEEQLKELMDNTRERAGNVPVKLWVDEDVDNPRKKMENGHQMLFNYVKAKGQTFHEIYKKKIA